MDPLPKNERCDLTKEDVCRTFDLLEQIYQGKKKPRDNVTLAIWAEILKPWSYAQVRSAVVQRARENRFFPDPSELAAYLPPIRDKGAEKSAPDGLLEAMEKKRKELDDWQEEWHQELRERGLPTLREAAARGMSPGEWNALLREADMWEAAHG